VLPLRLPPRGCCLAVPLLLPVGSWASEGTRSFAAPVHSVGERSTASGIFEVSLALLVVLAAIVAFAWLARRARLLTGRAGGRIEILADQSLGVKERIVLVRVRNAELLLGVAPGSVSALHTFAALEPAQVPLGDEPAALVTRSPSFAELLRKSLGR
jgi:flagellar protein FliO/FliZ